MYIYSSYNYKVDHISKITKITQREFLRVAISIKKNYTKYMIIEIILHFFKQ